MVVSGGCTLASSPRSLSPASGRWDKAQIALQNPGQVYCISIQGTQGRGKQTPAQQTLIKGPGLQQGPVWNVWTLSGNISLVTH